MKLKCGHEACVSCLTEFIKICCESNIDNIDSIHCFVSKCGMSLPHEIIKNILGKEKFE